MAAASTNWEASSVGDILFRQESSQDGFNWRLSMSVEPRRPDDEALCWVARLERWEYQRWACLRREEFFLDDDGYKSACEKLRFWSGSEDPCPAGDAASVVREATHLDSRLQAEALAQMMGPPVPGKSKYRDLIGGGAGAGSFTF